MPVTDTLAATLRAELAGQADEHRRLLDQLNWSTDGAAYVALLDAAFAEAVSRRFDAATGETDIAAYVADVRSRSERAAGAVSADGGERLIAMALGRGNVDDLDPKAVIPAKQQLLAALTADQGYDDEALDQFVRAARKTADAWLT